MKGVKKLLSTLLIAGSIISLPSVTNTYALDQNPTENQTIASSSPYRRDVVGQRATLNPGESTTLDISGSPSCNFKVSTKTYPNALNIRIHDSAGDYEFKKDYFNLEGTNITNSFTSIYLTYYLTVTNLGNTPLTVDMEILGK